MTENTCLSGNSIGEGVLLPWCEACFLKRKYVFWRTLSTVFIVLLVWKVTITVANKYKVLL